MLYLRLNIMHGSEFHLAFSVTDNLARYNDVVTNYTQ